ncbi:MAG: SRPBCC domain-containing protein [Polyangiaceae bacterium]
MNALKTVLDRETSTITFRRTFVASREDVFDAWTDPEQLKLWWDPTGTPLSECTVDLRPGGTFRFVNASSHAPPFSGVYKVIERPSELAFDAMGAYGTVRLEADGQHTRMTVTIRCATPEAFDHFVTLGIDTGTDQTLDNLVAHVTRKS